MKIWKHNIHMQPITTIQIPYNKLMATTTNITKWASWPINTKAWQSHQICCQHVNKTTTRPTHLLVQNNKINSSSTWKRAQLHPQWHGKINKHENQMKYIKSDQIPIWKSSTNQNQAYGTKIKSEKARQKEKNIKTGRTTHLWHKTTHILFFAMLLLNYSASLLD